MICYTISATYTGQRLRKETGLECDSLNMASLPRQAIRGVIEQKINNRPIRIIGEYAPSKVVVYVSR